MSLYAPGLGNIAAHMKIIEIVSDRSEVAVNGVQRIAFRTDPPLTDPVWNKFCEGGYQGDCWEKNDSLLVWVGDGNLDGSILNDTENCLSRIEGRLDPEQLKERGRIEGASRNEPTNGPGTDRKYLLKISRQTLRPVV
jgi:hypothetical protein